jgi:hypothetical protein
METYYIKKGKKYVPVGMAGPDLYEGVWLVQCESGNRSHKNLVMRIGDLPDPTDLTILAKAAMLEDIILKEMMDVWSGGKLASLGEAAQRIANKIATTETKLTQKNLMGL